MSDLLTMSQQELTRLEATQQLEGKTLEQKEAAEMLKISERHIRRLLRAYRQSGAEGLISKRRGKPNTNRLKEELKQQAIDLI